MKGFYKSAQILRCGTKKGQSDKSEVLGKVEASLGANIVLLPWKQRNQNPNSLKPHFQPATLRSMCFWVNIEIVFATAESSKAVYLCSIRTVVCVALPGHPWKWGLALLILMNLMPLNDTSLLLGLLAALTIEDSIVDSKQQNQRSVSKKCI